MSFKRITTLQLALGLSIAVHAALLAMRWADPEGFNRVFKDTPLEVILVNAKSNEAPSHAQAIAQANLAGGGDVAQGRSSTPLPPAPVEQSGDALDNVSRQIESMQQEQTQLLAQLKEQITQLPTPHALPPHPAPTQNEQEERRRQLIKLLAEIEKQINEQNARPRKRYVSPATREAIYAVYYDTVRRKIEDRGTVNFPQAAGRKLYGELTMALTVGANGHVLETQVLLPSKNSLLDRQAQAIVKSIVFDHFTPAMRQKADQLVLVSRFKFTHNETLQAQVLDQP